MPDTAELLGMPAFEDEYTQTAVDVNSPLFAAPESVKFNKAPDGSRIATIGTSVGSCILSEDTLYGDMVGCTRAEFMAVHSLSTIAEFTPTQEGLEGVDDKSVFGFNIAFSELVSFANRVSTDERVAIPPVITEITQLGAISTHLHRCLVTGGESIPPTRYRHRTSVAAYETMKVHVLKIQSDLDDTSRLSKKGRAARQDLRGALEQATVKLLELETAMQTQEDNVSFQAVRKSKLTGLLRALERKRDDVLGSINLDVEPIFNYGSMDLTINLPKTALEASQMLDVMYRASLVLKSSNLNVIDIHDEAVDVDISIKLLDNAMRWLSAAEAVLRKDQNRSVTLAA